MPTPAKKTASPVRTGAWVAAQRRKLSAIQHPHKADPADFYFDAASAQEKLAATGDFPPTLTVESEKARQSYLSSYVGVSWKTATGRVFTDEYWNPLIGLWVARNGWDFVFDLVMPNPKDPAKFELRDSDAAQAWYAVRRYLWKASAEDYARARARCAPAFQALRGDLHYDLAKGRDLLAYAFDRDSDWAQQVLTEYAAGRIKFANVALLTAVCPDVALSMKAVDQAKQIREVYWVFDMVETLGSASLQLLPRVELRGAVDRKRVEAATAIAEKLKVLGL
jgi:hypothetical protein